MRLLRLMFVAGTALIATIGGIAGTGSSTHSEILRERPYRGTLSADLFSGSSPSAFLPWLDPTPTTTTTTTLPPAPAPRKNHGPHSDAWWQGVSICEQGGRDDPYYGYFSVMDGSSGGLSWDQQVQLANGIIARYGEGAWAASCVQSGYRAAPGG